MRRMVGCRTASWASADDEPRRARARAHHACGCGLRRHACASCHRRPVRTAEARVRWQRAELPRAAGLFDDGHREWSKSHFISHFPPLMDATVTGLLGPMDANRFSSSNFSVDLVLLCIYMNSLNPGAFEKGQQTPARTGELAELGEKQFTRWW